MGIEFKRWLDEDWAQAPLEAGFKYDTVESHGWYDNLDITAEQLSQDMRLAKCSSIIREARAS